MLPSPLLYVPCTLTFFRPQVQWCVCAGVLCQTLKAECVWRLA
jgi:hypothetical protein